MQKKILHIIPGLDDPTCGIAVAAKMIIRKQIATGDSVEYVDFKKWTKQQIGAADEVWVHSMWTPSVMSAVLTATRLNKIVVRMPHGCMDPTKVKHHWYKKCWVAPIERWLFRKVNRIVATCANEVEWVRKFEPKVREVEVVSLASERDFKCQKEDNDCKDGEVKFLYIGRLHPLKGVEFLLQAMNEYQRSLRPLRSLRLKIIGKDEGEGEKLRRMTTEFGLNVEFCGVVSEEEKERAWDWCDVLVLPTLSENFGLVVAEALERGKRVITTDGAPAWGDGNDYDGRLVYLRGYVEAQNGEKVRFLNEALQKFSARKE